MTKVKNTFSMGTNLKEKNHLLMKVTKDELVTIIKQGNKGLNKQIEILRKVLRYDQGRYRMMKTQLPYFSCSHFIPSIRRMENFSYAVGLILDIDKVEDITKVHDKVQQDERVAIAYTSPSGRGIKVVFLFDKPIYDIIQYSAFYKWFSSQWAYQTNLINCVDFVNSDASRVSFISYDPNVYLNQDYIPLCWNEEMPLIDIHQENNHEKTDKLIPPDTYKYIIQKLGSKPIMSRNVINIGPEIEKVLPELKDALREYHIEINKVEGIQNGVKIHIQLQKDTGEVNVYYGKKGFSVVSSPKKGTKYELNEDARHIIQTSLPMSRIQIPF